MVSQKDFIRGSVRVKVQPLTVLYTIFDRKGTRFVYLLLTNDTSLTYIVTSTYYLYRNHRLPHLSYSSISEIPTLYHVWILLVMTHPNLDSRVFQGNIAWLWPERPRRRLHGSRLLRPGENGTARKSYLYFLWVCGRNIPKVVSSLICTEKNSFSRWLTKVKHH